MRRRPRVNLHIEELVLHGFAPGDRHRIGDAVERHLALLLAERGLPPTLSGGVEIARLDAGSFDVARGMPARTVGAQLAQALFGGLSR